MMPREGVVSAPAPLVGVVQQAWAEILGVEQVGPDDDFFDLGGHSLLAPTAVALLGDRVGHDLAPRALFEAPTPVEMAELIEELRAAPAPLPTAPAHGTTPFLPGWVVTLQPDGRGRPVFVFPGGLGGKWILLRDARIAALVGRERPFFGFRRDGGLTHGEQSVPAMAGAYLEQIRAVQGTGPYLLYGVCSGGALAWETARQLLAAGEAVAGILLFEAPLRTEQVSVTLAARPDRPALAGLVPPYAPEPLAVDVTLLMTEAWHARGRSDGWPLVTWGRLERVLMPGDSPGAHNMYAGREAVIAGHVRDWIARAEARG